MEALVEDVDSLKSRVTNVEKRQDALEEELTEEEISETFGLQDVRKKMADYTANLGFGQKAFVVGGAR